ncbi:hypothetical protein [Cupriavidus basilensis]|nr:hypothetical protein [Cupriavidus basilensis]
MQGASPSLSLDGHDARRRGRCHRHVARWSALGGGLLIGLAAAALVLLGAGAWQGAVSVLAMLAGMALFEWLEWLGRGRALPGKAFAGH